MIRSPASLVPASLVPVSLVIAALALPLAVAAQPAVPAAAEAEAEADSAAVVAAARARIAQRYVVPETAARLDAALGEAEARGQFAGLAGEALAVRINAVMRTVTADGHLGVSWNPALSAELAAAGPPQEGEDALPAEFLRQIEQENAGVRRLELLPGNIRYLDYRGFWWGTPGPSRRSPRRWSSSAAATR